MREILRYFKPYRSKLILVGMLHTAATLSELFMPYIMSEIVDEGIRGGNMEYILGMGLVMLGLSALAFGCGLVTTRINAGVSAGFCNGLQKAVFNKINSLTFEEYSRIGTSSLLTRSTDDVFNLQDAANGFVYAAVTVPIMFIGGAVLAFLSDWLLALVLVVIAPAVLFLVWLVTRRMGALWENSDKYIDIQNKAVRERLSGLRVIRAFSKEGHEHGRIADATWEMAKNIIKANVLAGLINPLSLLLLNLSTVAMLYIGAVRIQSEPLLQAGGVIATIQYVALIMNGLLVLSWTFAWLPHLKVCTRRIAEVLKMEGLAQQAASGERLDGALSLRDVTFRYEGADLPALRGVNMEIQAGEVISVIGGTGSGKSTLVKLILDFYTPTEGEICLGGRSYRALRRETVRDNISVALQKSMIFDATVAENIRMGDKDAPEEKLDEVTRIAQIADFVHSHEEGYEYKLAQAGANVSGGQKQRINIARTIIKDAALYIFDDSFSALDYLTESKLRRELNRYLAGKTQMIVTQRAATAMRSDRIYVLDRGQVVGAGTHAELLETCRIYREIYDSQLGGRA